MDNTFESIEEKSKIFYSLKPNLFFVRSFGNLYFVAKISPLFAQLCTITDISCLLNLLGKKRNLVET